jgi:hypothetical protein
LKHTFRISTSKEINSFKNGITHPGDIMSHVILFFGLLHSTGCLLHDWVYHLFTVDPRPIVVFKVKVYHIVR